MQQTDNQTQVTVPATELSFRIASLQNELEKKGFSGALILQKTDLFYYSGTSQQGWLYVPVVGNPILMVFKEYRRACYESALEEVVSIPSIKKIPQILVDYGHSLNGVLGMELDVLPANLYFQYKALFKECEIKDISLEIRLLRAVKSDYEITKIRAAAELSDKLAEHVKTILLPGKSEVELAGQLEGYARGLGHQGLVRMRMFNNELFYGHLLSGEGAAVASYLQSPTGGRGVSSVIGQGAGYRQVRKNEPVLVDFVFALDGYLSDHARIFSLGKPASKLIEAHASMVELQNRTKKLCKPGVVAGDLYEQMVQFSSSNGMADNFMGVGDRRIRFTGHGVGLELDEFPFIAKGQKLELVKGMVIALEPKTIFPGEGVVGIENTHLVGEAGLEPLSSYPDEITIL